MNKEVVNFLISEFRDYYQHNFNSIQIPPRLPEREFGFFHFGKRIVTRHRSFLDKEKLQSYLEKDVPQHAFYSAAYYENPSNLKMNRKGWRGADLIFDIDADHIDTPCKSEHDSWECKKCGTTGTGIKPSECPRCQNTSFDDESWMCNKCLEVAKQETKKLIDDFLISDFGIASDQITVVFSGHRGYHVHVRPEFIHTIDQAARREIVDYIRGYGISPESHGLTSRFGPMPNDKGWQGRIARAIMNYIKHANVDQLKTLPNWDKKTASLLDKNRENVMEMINRSLYDAIKGIKPTHWISLANKAILEAGVKIDEPVTTDVHRLIRLPGSLHGKTGLKVTPIMINELLKFNPLIDAVVFEGNVNVHIKKAPNISIGGETFKTTKNETVELPKAAAIYLLARGAATLREG